MDGFYHISKSITANRGTLTQALNNRISALLTPYRVRATLIPILAIIGTASLPSFIIACVLVFN